MDDECWHVRDWLFMWTDRGETAEAVVAGARRQGVRLDPDQVSGYLAQLRRLPARDPREPFDRDPGPGPKPVGPTPRPRAAAVVLAASA